MYIVRTGIGRREGDFWDVSAAVRAPSLSTALSIRVGWREDEGSSAPVAT